MTVILRTSNYDTWGEFLRGQSCKQNFRVVNDGDDHLTVILSQLRVRALDETSSTKKKRASSTILLYPFTRCGICAGSSSDYTILGKEFIAQFVIDGKVVLTRHCNIETERGYVFGHVVDEMIFGLRESSIRFKPVPKLSSSSLLVSAITKVFSPIHILFVSGRDGKHLPKLQSFALIH